MWATHHACIGQARIFTVTAHSVGQFGTAVPSQGSRQGATIVELSRKNYVR